VLLAQRGTLLWTSTRRSKFFIYSKYIYPFSIECLTSVIPATKSLLPRLSQTLLMRRRLRTRWRELNPLRVRKGLPGDRSMARKAQPPSLLRWPVGSARPQSNNLLLNM
jgi:hypothetical protein